MCGIAGWIGNKSINESERLIASEMLKRLHHRGPDDKGIFVGMNSVLVHSRLSIIDIKGGKQPMSNQADNIHIIYNGEIYNFRALRDKLIQNGIQFYTKSDTEVILKLYESEGINALSKLKGMFAFAILNEQYNRLILMRDQWGMKPLYYHINNQTLYFASEIKALLAHPDIPCERDLTAFHDFLNLRFTPAPETLFKNIKRLLPGRALIWENGNIKEESVLSVPALLPLDHSIEVLKPSLLSSFENAVSSHLVSDVQVGCYLSGGLDSTAITCFAKKHLNSLPTFTLGFGDEHDELKDAEKAANYYGTDHHNEVLDASSLINDYTDTIYFVEEPQINILQSYRIAKLASKHVKVVLSGMGGDELFGGYHTHRWFAYLSNVHKYKKLFAAPISAAGKIISQLTSPFGPRFDLGRRGMEVIFAKSPALSWAILRNVWDYDLNFRKRIYNSTFDPPSVMRHISPHFDNREPLEAVFDTEIKLKLEGNFLAGEDRTSMAFGLEVRAPFLDIELASLARTIPVKEHINFGKGKSLYRKIISDLLPEPLRQKKKWGFSFDPILQWDNTIRPYVEKRLTPENFERISPVSPDYINKLLNFDSGRTLRWHRFFLWMLAGYVDWHKIFIENRGKR